LIDHFTKFNPQTEIFTELPKLPFPTFAPAAGLIGSEAYLFGGMFKTGQWDYEYVSHIYKYNFTRNNWEHTGRFLAEYKGFSQVVNMGKCLGVLGGHSYQRGEDRPVDSVEVLCASK